MKIIARRMLGIPAVFALIVVPGAGQDKKVSIADCSFRSDPQSYAGRDLQIRKEINFRSRALNMALADAPGRRAAQEPVPRRNFIDDEIFDKLESARVAPARLTSDEEFLRRIRLDLTGKLPGPDEIRAFAADSNPNKRNALIERLLWSPDFTDRWTMWMGDLLQINASATNFSRQIDGRNAFYIWTYRQIGSEKSLRSIAWDCIAARGNNYDPDTGAANFAAAFITPMGPSQDMYDTALVKTASTFLGMGHYDCLLCHNGRRHLEDLSLWGGTATRLEAQTMASWFSRVRVNANPTRQGEGFYYNSRDITDVNTGQYDLSTNYGNRPNRNAVGTTRSVTPAYRDGKPPEPNMTWRESLAYKVIADTMFARNMANRIWKQLFGLGLVDPADLLDPPRLDPYNPPAAPWALQATHPLLLEKLAYALAGTDYNLREFVKLLVQSSAYQLSSRYEGDWKLEYVPLFARHYPRRLEGEEIHDAILSATGTTVTYTLQGLDPVKWAVQLPEPVEPRSNGSSANFMNVFLRGNRDTLQRSQAGSILQQLFLMNDAFVNNRTRKTASPALQAISRLTSNDDVVREMFLAFLARSATDYEKRKALEHLSKYSNTAAARDGAIEDLAWALINKIDFLYSY